MAATTDLTFDLLRLSRLHAAAPDAHAILCELGRWFVEGNGPRPSSLFDDERTWNEVLVSYFAKASGQVA